MSHSVRFKNIISFFSNILYILLLYIINNSKIHVAMNFRIQNFDEKIVSSNFIKIT